METYGSICGNRQPLGQSSCESCKRENQTIYKKPQCVQCAAVNAWFNMDILNHVAYVEKNKHRLTQSGKKDFIELMSSALVTGKPEELTPYIKQAIGEQLDIVWGNHDLVSPEVAKARQRERDDELEKDLLGQYDA